MTSVIRKVRKVASWPLFEKAWIVPAWLLLGISRLALFTLPFRYVAPWLGTQAGTSQWIPLPGAEREARASAIGTTVRRAACFTPWQSNCLVQAMAAALILQIYRVPYTMFLGMTREKAGGDSAALNFRAHAWVASGRVRVTGGASFRSFTVVGFFAGGGAAGAPGHWQS